MIRFRSHRCRCCFSSPLNRGRGRFRYHFFLYLFIAWNADRFESQVIKFNVGELHQDGFIGQNIAIVIRKWNFQNVPRSGLKMFSGFSRNIFGTELAIEHRACLRRERLDSKLVPDFKYKTHTSS